MKKLPFLIPMLLSIQAAYPQSPYPGGPLADKPNPFYETETQQVGGAGWNWYSYVGALRCTSENQAIVRLYSRRGSVLDYVRIACANISCGPQGCGWTQANWGAGVGDANGGTLTSTDMCPTNMIVAGFRGEAPGTAPMPPISRSSAPS